MTARVILGVGPAAPVIVPLTAVVDNGQGPQVWIVADGKASPHAVEVTRFAEDGVAITRGVQAGDAVILTGQRRLTPGQAVQAQTATPPARQH
jgi:hypothetical protein